MSDLASALMAPPPRTTARPGAPPTLSVLIPAYNAADTIGAAIESVLTQKPAPMEVIVSDDGSEDDLSSVLTQFGDRLRVISGPNRGLATARNRAAGVARGALLGLLDADDVWLPGRVAALTTAAATRPDLSVITTDAVVVRNGRRDSDTYYATRHFAVTDQVDAILRSNFIFGAGAVRAAALDAAGGYDPAARRAEDWDLWLRLILNGHRAGLVPVPLYEYRRRVDSLTGQKVDLGLAVMAVLDRARPLLRDDRQRAVLDRTQRQWWASTVSAARRARDPRCRELAREALRIPGQPALVRARFAAMSVLPGIERGRR